MKKISFVFVAVLLLAGSCNSTRFNPDSLYWLQFRGPNASGIAPNNANPPLHFNPDTNLLWKTPVMPGWSSPCIVNDRIFLSGFGTRDSLLYTMAFDRETGKLLWQDAVVPGDYPDIHPMNSYASPTIASNGKNIYVSFLNYGMIAYDLDGNKSWEYKHEAAIYFYGSANSPIIDDSVVILNISATDDPRIMGLDCETGDSVWTIRPGDYPWRNFGNVSTPVLWNNLIIFQGDGYIMAYDLTTRDAKWWIRAPGAGSATPVIKGDKMILNTYFQAGEKKVRGEVKPFSYYLDKIDANKNGKLEQSEFSDTMFIWKRPEIMDLPLVTLRLGEDKMFRFFDRDGDHAYNEEEWNGLRQTFKNYVGEHGMLCLSLEGSGERPMTDVEWKINEDTPETPSPLVVNDNAFFIKNGGIVTVVHIDDGSIVFKKRVGAPGAYLSSPLLADGRIYVCSYNGVVTVLSGDDFKVLAKNRIGGKIGASPVAVGNVLYLRTDQYLYAFRKK